MCKHTHTHTRASKSTQEALPLEIRNGGWGKKDLPFCHISFLCHLVFLLYVYLNFSREKKFLSNKMNKSIDLKKILVQVNGIKM